MKTVFIIGAGASTEADLPMGTELKKHIADALNLRNGGDQLIGDAFDFICSRQHGGFTLDALHNASRRIRDAMPQAISIDNFLDAHADNKAIELCGKLGIVRTILKAEQRSNLFVNRSEDTKPRFSQVEEKWFNIFFQSLNEGCRQGDLEKRLSSIVLIIFNYDRCVEHYIYHSLQNYYGMSDIDAAELLKGIEIYHPYGMVGALPFICPESYVHFGAAPHPTRLIELTKGIKTFTEGTNEDSSDIQAIRQRVQEATRLVFLGFAFHRMNMNLLLPSLATAATSESRVFATAFGLSGADTDMILDEFVVKGWNANNIEIDHQTCGQFFKVYRRSLSFT